MLKNLLRLLHFVTDPGDPRVDRSLERLLSWQTAEGYIRGPVANGLPQPHHNGQALYILVGFFAEEDPRVNKLAEWLMSIQRKDGGWNMPYIQDVRYLPRYKDLGMSEFIAMHIRSVGIVPSVRKLITCPAACTPASVRPDPMIETSSLTIFPSAHSSSD